MKRSDLVKAALKKGFVERTPRGAKHDVYVYVHNEIEVGSIMLTASRSHSDLSQDMIAMYRRQLHFDTKSQLAAYVACTFDAHQYATLLISKGMISSA